MGTPRGDYAGAFGHVVEALITRLVYGHKALHLYSGASKIGDVRVDISHPNATHKLDVADWISSDDDTTWDIVLLDPPYETASRLYGRKETALSKNVSLRRRFEQWAAIHARRVLWLDGCAPIFKPFEREMVWLVLPGGYRRVRVLSLLKNTNFDFVKGRMSATTD